MIRFFLSLLTLLLFLLNPLNVFAQSSSSFVSVVNPVRGDDFWDIKNQAPLDAVKGEAEIIKSANISSTWLLRFDALSNKSIIEEIKKTSGEKGLFLEITPSLTTTANVGYHKSENWHSAGSAFLTGYEVGEREKLIDASFLKFKEIFGYYPKSVGAWWVDSYSLNYMQEKYGINSSLIVSDQYTTDNYQIWGQYFSTPYYPDKLSALRPAQSKENKISVVLVQWAARDPVNGYGNGVFESTFSVQANDYMDFHSLDTNYFSKLIDIYTKQQFNQFGQIVVGLENTYEWSKYKDEYKRQIETLVSKKNNGQIKIVTMEEFANWYKSSFPDLSPTSLVIADDPLGSFKKVVWFMNPYYRAGWFLNADGSVFRDIRQYVEGTEEICLKKRCDEVNFATFATRVLDEVTYGHKWVIDEGKISDFKVTPQDEKYLLTYLNEAGNNRVVEFLPRDIGVDGKIYSIDGAILEAIKQDKSDITKQINFPREGFKWSILKVISKTLGFLLFLTIFCIVPGMVLLNRIVEKDESSLKKVFLATTIGFVLFTLIFYLFSLINLRLMVLVYALVSLFFFFKLKLFKDLKFKLDFFPLMVVLAGTIFQITPSFKNGLVYPFGMGFWGPNTHDGIWHLSLINSLVKGFPVQNPVFADTVLKNYHFFYDLLIAATTIVTNIPILDLVFRFYPIIFSLFLGIGTYYLAQYFSKTKLAVIFSLFFVYFSGSFGWIVEYIKQKTLGGESAFWANQSISFNLNPPFAVSLLIVIAILLLLQLNKNRTFIFILALLTGSLIAFKSYGGVLVIATFFIYALLKFNLKYLIVGFTSSIFSAILFLSNFTIGQSLIIFSPFWFIHSMVDSPDRVGWTRLSLARIAGLETKNYFKFISAEILSLFIFIVGNLGLRILSLFSLTKVKEIFKNELYLFISILTLLSFSVPIIFIQSGNPWNTIQFSYYGLYTTALISGGVLSSIAYKLPKTLALLIVAVILILTPINSITTASYYTGFLPHGRVDSKELEALNFLSKQPDGIVLTYPYDKKIKTRIPEPWPLFAYDSTAYVSALSGKGVYLEDEGQNQILLTDYKKRLVASKDFFFNPRFEFLKDNKISYIYLPKIFNIRVPENLVENIFENSESILYKVK